MELGTIQNPTVIYRDEMKGRRILAWHQTRALLPEFEPLSQLVLTSELFDPDPLSGGWLSDDAMAFDEGEAGAARAAIDAFLTPDGFDISHLTKHGLTEGETSLLIEPGFDENLDPGWGLTDEHGEQVWLTPSRLEWLALLAPQVLASYKAAQRCEEVGNA